MEATTLPATRRTHLGSKHTRRIRQRGQIPAIIYGHNEAPVPIALDAHEIENLLHHHSRVVNLELDNQATQYLIKAVQYDHLDTTPIHLDLMRVNLDEKVEVQVEVVLKGTPAGAADGGILLQNVNDVRVSCLVTNIPEELKLPVSELGLGESVYVRDIKLPDGIEMLNEPDEMIAVCREPTVAASEEEEATEEGATEGAEPEVIGKKPEEEDAE
jgi:large subunit ribosomal protein L25